MSRFTERSIPIADVRAAHEGLDTAWRKQRTNVGRLKQHRRAALHSFKGNDDYTGVERDYDEAISAASDRLKARRIALRGTEKELRLYERTKRFVLDLNSNAGLQQAARNNPERLRYYEERRRTLFNELLRNQHYQYLAAIGTELGSKAVSPEVFRGSLTPQETVKLFLDTSHDTFGWTKEMAYSGDPVAMIHYYVKIGQGDRVLRKLELLGYNTPKYSQLLEQTLNNREAQSRNRTQLRRSTGNSGNDGPTTYREIEPDLTRASWRILLGTDSTRGRERRLTPQSVISEDLIYNVGLRNLREVGTLVPTIEGFPGVTTEQATSD